MKRTSELNEFIKQLEEAIDAMLDEMKAEHVNINLSVSLCPMVLMNSVSMGKNPVDIIETEKTVHAMIGLPGMELDDISMNCDGKSLEITATNNEITYNESIDLPAMVKKSGMKTTYKNGILEVIFNKRKKRSIKGKAANNL